MQGSTYSYHLRPENIDYRALTHIIHFSLIPRADGSLDDITNGVSAENAASITGAAHAEGRKVLISVGGWESERLFDSATSDAHLASFVRNLLDLVTERNYDGIDIDWEPISPQDVGQMSALVTRLDSLMREMNPNLLLTATAGWQPSMFARLQHSFDQINLLSYDFSGPWPGWISWHNSPLYDAGFLFPDTDRVVPSIDSMLAEYVSAGLEKSKLGIGIDFYGYIWRGGTGTTTGGVTAPRQSWVDPPVVSSIPYYSIMHDYYQPEYYRWDTSAAAAYLSLDDTGSIHDAFISYDDERACAEKIGFAIRNGLGGAIVWELGGGWRPDVPTHDTLLRSIGKAAFGTTAVRASSDPNPITFWIEQNFPNPFNPSTTVRLTVPAQARVTIKLFDVLGAEVATLVDDDVSSGTHSLSLLGYNLSSGMYFLRFQAPGMIATRKCVVVR